MAQVGKSPLTRLAANLQAWPFHAKRPWLRLRLQGDAARDDRDWPRAAKAYSTYLKLNEHDAAIWVQYGHSLKEQNLFAEAEQAYRKALTLMPGDSDAQMHLARLLEWLDRPEDAQRMLAALPQTPPSPDVLREGEATWRMEAPHGAQREVSILLNLGTAPWAGPNNTLTVTVGGDPSRAAHSRVRIGFTGPMTMAQEADTSEAAGVQALGHAPAEAPHARPEPLEPALLPPAGKAGVDGGDGQRDTHRRGSSPGQRVKVVGSLDELDAMLAECDAAPDDATRFSILSRFRMDPSVWTGLASTADPLGRNYHAGQMALYRRISGRSYSLANEETQFDVDAAVRRPFPYSTGSTGMAGDHLASVGEFLRCLDLPRGARVLELGAGWGNLTLALAALGFDVTAIDVEARFCALIRERAARLGLLVRVEHADFSWVESVAEPFDAILFLDSFNHAADHLGLLCSLHRALTPRGRIHLGAEPIVADFPLPWGLRLDGESLWSIRKFGRMELGFSEAYFEQALGATGWSGTRCASPPPGTWVLRRSEEPVHVKATDSRLGTFTGTRTETGIAVSDAAEGYCLFGPYQALAPGRYMAVVELEGGAPFSGSGSIDASVQGASNVVAARPFLAGPGAPPPSLVFDLATACTDLEVRLHGDAGLSATITGLSIAKLPDWDAA